MYNKKTARPEGASGSWGFWSRTLADSFKEDFHAGKTAGRNSIPYYFPFGF